MTPRERVLLALTFSRLDRAPPDLWSHPGVAMSRLNELERMRVQYLSDFGGPGLGYDRGLAASGDVCRSGGCTDEWGCTFEVYEDGVIGEIKPLYREYATMVRARGKFVFFHSGGMIEDIIPDLVEIGVHALNSQRFCMDIEELGRWFKGRITFWGEIDRQQVLPFGTMDDVRAAASREEDRGSVDRGAAP